MFGQELSLDEIKTTYTWRAFKWRISTSVTERTHGQRKKKTTKTKKVLKICTYTSVEPTSAVRLLPTAGPSRRLTTVLCGVNRWGVFCWTGVDVTLMISCSQPLVSGQAGGGFYTVPVWYRVSCNTVFPHSVVSPSHQCWSVLLFPPACR